MWASMDLSHRHILALRQGGHVLHRTCIIAVIAPRVAERAIGMGRSQLPAYWTCQMPRPSSRTALPSALASYTLLTNSVWSAIPGRFRGRLWIA